MEPNTLNDVEHEQAMRAGLRRLGYRERSYRQFTRDRAPLCRADTILVLSGDGRNLSYRTHRTIVDCHPAVIRAVAKLGHRTLEEPVKALREHLKAFMAEYEEGTR